MSLCCQTIPACGSTKVLIIISASAVVSIVLLLLSWERQKATCLDFFSVVVVSGLTQRSLCAATFSYSYNNNYCWRLINYHFWQKVSRCTERWLKRHNESPFPVFLCIQHVLLCVHTPQIAVWKLTRRARSHAGLMHKYDNICITCRQRTTSALDFQHVISRVYKNGICKF